MHKTVAAGAAAVVCFLGLTVTILAFGDLPLLGGLFGAALSGALAGLLLPEPRAAARSALVASGAAMVLLGYAAAFQPGLLLASPGGPPPAPVLLVEGLELGFVPTLVAAGIAALLGRPPSQPRPAAAEPRGDEPDDPRDAL